MVLPYINMNLPQVYTCSPSWTPLSPPSLYHPSGSSQYTSPKHPVSCIEPGLSICFIYDIIHVSMTFSQIIPPSPSPTESKRLFYTSVSLLLSRIQCYHYHLSKFRIYVFSSVQFSSVAQSWTTLCNPMNRSTPGFHHQLPELAQTHVHLVGDAIQPSHALSSPSSPDFNLSQHQGLLQWVSSLHQMVKVLEFQLQHQSFQWVFRTNFL